MPRNGSGTFNRLYSWEDDAANNIKIRADRMDAEMDGMATALTNSIAVDGQTASVYQHTFETKAEAETSSLPSVTDAFFIQGYTSAGDGGGALYKRVASEPSHAGKIQSGDGAWWELSVPFVTQQMFGGSITDAQDHANNAPLDLNLFPTLSRSQKFMHFDVDATGGIAIVDTVDDTKKRQTFMIERTVDDLATADFTDPNSGAFTQPILVGLRYTANGEFGSPQGRGVRIINCRLENNTDSAGTSANWAVYNGGETGKSSWGHVIEGYDTSAQPGGTQGDPDEDPAADIQGASNNIYIGIEINHKLKLNSTFVGLQIFPNTYGRLVDDNAGVRPKAQRCIAISPGNDGGPGSPDKTGADILRAIDIFGQPPDHVGEAGAAHTDYGIWGRVPMNVAIMAMAHGDKIIFDNDDGENVNITSPNSSQFTVNIGASEMLLVTANAVRARSAFQITGGAGTNRPFEWRSGPNARWSLIVNNTAESGSDSGSNLELNRVSDAGALTEVLFINRNTGRAIFREQVAMDGLPTSSSGLSTGDLWNNSGVVNIV